MIIAALNEGPQEPRVAITPNIAHRYTELGHKVICEAGAGNASGFSDEEYKKAGASIEKSRQKLLKQTNILLTVNAPSPKNLKGLGLEALIITHMDNSDTDLLAWAIAENISLFSMNDIPRISRAQNLDSLSSQANLAGYKAVLEAVHHFKRAVPMMMTAAGMIQPAKVLVLGAGVAGLQAIATAKRLGALIYAFDVRAAAKEQVESLGAEFIEVPQEENLETKGGYAQEMSDKYKALQAELIDKYAQMADMIICTALIPNKEAPLLISKTTLEKMKPGSVVVDLATARGGNCAYSQPEKIVHHLGVTIIGISNMAGLIPATASELYANNLLNLVKLLSHGERLYFNPDDEIIQSALLCYERQLRPFFGEIKCQN